MAASVTDACLVDCIETLGERAEFPSEDDLRTAIPGLVTRHGVATTRVMLASAVVGNAPASAAIMAILKSDAGLAPTSPTPG